MTKEQRIIFELKDIVAFRVKCRRCGAEIVLDPSTESARFMPKACGSCNCEFSRKNMEKKETTDFLEDILIRALSCIRDCGMVTLLFELKDDPLGRSRCHAWW